MKIAVDGGGLCTDKHFGTYTFSSSLISALRQYDKKNKYTIYTFCKRNSEKNFQFKNLQPTLGWMKLRVPLEELINRKDIFLGLNQALPSYTSGNSIVFSHGFSFSLFPEFYGNDIERLEKQLKDYISRSKFIVVSSERICQEFIKFYPKTKDKIVTMVYGIPEIFETYEKMPRKPYFLFTGMNHGIKNREFLVKAFQKFRSEKKYSHFKLYLVGPHSEYENASIKVFRGLNRKELQKLYREATGYITASYYESFNYPVLEALSQMCPVLGLESAIIPEMQKYCMVIHNKADFVMGMVQMADRKDAKVDLESLREDFSWKKFVFKLQELYQKA